MKFMNVNLTFHYKYYTTLYRLILILVIHFTSRFKHLVFHFPLYLNKLVITLLALLILILILIIWKIFSESEWIWSIITLLYQYEMRPDLPDHVGIFHFINIPQFLISLSFTYFVGVSQSPARPGLITGVDIAAKDETFQTGLVTFLL